MIVALDFDGTLTTHMWPDLGEDIGAFEWVIPLQEKYPGLRYILWTVRTYKPLENAVKFCSDKGLHFWGVNKNPDQHSWSSSSKAHAHCYVDDAALGTPLIHRSERIRSYVNWAEMGPLLTRRVDEHFKMVVLRRGARNA